MQTRVGATLAGVALGALLLAVAWLYVATPGRGTAMRTAGEPAATLPFPRGFFWGAALSGHQAETQQASDWTAFEDDVVRKVILPAAVPLIIAGMRIGLGRALHGVVLGEMFSSNAGLGYRVTFYAAHLRTADVFVPLVILVVIGLVINQLGNALEARLQAWKA